MADRVRFALIGLGRFGTKRLKSLLRNSAIVDLAYIADVDSSLASKVAVETESTAVSPDELLEKKDFDVAIVAVPNSYHEENVIRLLERGKDVWCEKPLSTSSDSSRRMLVKSLEVRRCLKVGSNARFFPNVWRAKASMEGESLGRILFVRGQIGNAGTHLQGKSWYANAQTIGGGTLLDNGIHLIDLTRWMTSEIVECLACRTERLKWALEGIEDNAFALYRTEEGALFSLHSSWTDSSGYMALLIQGTDRFVDIDSRFSNSILTTPNAREDFSTDSKQSYDYELEHFVSDYNAGIHPSPTSYDGYRGVKVVEGSYVAAQSGLPARLIDQRDREMLSRFKRVFS